MNKKRKKTLGRFLGRFGRSAVGKGLGLKTSNMADGLDVFELENFVIKKVEKFTDFAFETMKLFFNFLTY